MLLKPYQGLIINQLKNKTPSKTAKKKKTGTNVIQQPNRSEQPTTSKHSAQQPSKKTTQHSPNKQSVPTKPAIPITSQNNQPQIAKQQLVQQADESNQ